MMDGIALAMKRIQRYNFEDGTFELLTGVIFFLTGVLLNPLPVADFPQGLSVLGFILAVILTIVLVNQLRQHYVYPRSGYVNTALDPSVLREHLLHYLLVFLVLIIAAVLIMSPLFFIEAGQNGDGGFSWTTFTFGLVMSLPIAFLGFRLGFPRLVMVALISAGLAVFFSPIVLSNQTYYFSNQQHPYWVIYASQIFMAGYFLLMALVLIFVGGMAFLNYLRTNPIPMEKPNE